MKHSRATGRSLGSNWFAIDSVDTKPLHVFLVVFCWGRIRKPNRKPNRSQSRTPNRKRIENRSERMMRCT